MDEDRGDAAAFARLNPLVDVLSSPPDPLAQRRRNRGLASAHEPHEVELVGPHARSDSSTEKNSGYDTAAAPAPWMVVGPVAPSAAIANAIARR